MDEVNEIKALYDKAQEEMKENFENELASGAGPNYTNKLEERMLEKAAGEKDKEEQKQEPN